MREVKVDATKLAVKPATRPVQVPVAAGQLIFLNIFHEKRW
jgi:hypothetical protein